MTHKVTKDIEMVQGKEKRYVMALDQGTTSSRCILFDYAGRICSAAQKEFTQYYPQPGWVEHDAQEIWSTQLEVAVKAMEKAGVKAGDIAGIGITNQRETTIVWDKRRESRYVLRLSGSAAGLHRWSRLLQSRAGEI